jgi:hypothetical protein
MGRVHAQVSEVAGERKRWVRDMGLGAAGDHLSNNLWRKWLIILISTKMIKTSN